MCHVICFFAGWLWPSSHITLCGSRPGAPVSSHSPKACSSGSTLSELGRALFFVSATWFFVNLSRACPVPHRVLTDSSVLCPVSCQRWACVANGESMGWKVRHLAEASAGKQWQKHRELLIGVFKDIRHKWSCHNVGQQSHFLPHFRKQAKFKTKKSE